MTMKCECPICSIINQDKTNASLSSFIKSRSKIQDIDLGKVINLRDLREELRAKAAQEELEFRLMLVGGIMANKTNRREEEKPQYTINFERSGLVEAIAPDNRPYYNRLKELGLIFNSKKDAYAVAKSAITLAKTLQEHSENE